MSAISKIFRYLIFVLIFSLIFLLILWGANQKEIPEETETENDQFPTNRLTIVLDAGHGGEDGGASSADGVSEKTLNLKICSYLKDYLTAAGAEVVMTRSEDILLYDRSVPYQGRKKVLDLAARRKAGSTVNPDIFISIHMNAFTDSRYSGLQVWYSPNNTASADYAFEVQNTVEQYLQNDNHRKIKESGSNIYLLHQLTCPSILIECGFLSNPDEAELLQNEDYQKQLAYLIFCAILQTDSQ